VTTDFGRRTTVDQRPGGGSRYPFAAKTGLAKAVLDAYVGYGDPGGDVGLPLSLGVLDAAAPTFRLVDAGGAEVTVLPASTARQTTWGDRVVYEWADVPADRVVRLVVRTAGLVGLAGSYAPLDFRTCDRLPLRLTALSVGGQTLRGRVAFEPGYNAVVAATPAPAADGGRRTSRLTVGAVPGAGLGVAPGCEAADVVLRTIQGVGPDAAGNFNLTAEGVLSVRRAAAVAGPDDDRRATPSAGLVLANDGGPCCPCEGYVNTYRALKRQWDAWADLAARLTAIRDAYATLRQRWVDHNECRAASPATLVLTAEGGSAAFAGGSFCNRTDCCLSNVELRFTFDRPVTVIEAYADGTGLAPATPVVPLVQGPVVRVFFDAAGPGRTAIARLRVCTACEGDQLAATLTAHAPDPGDCALSQADVPPAVAAAWAANAVPDADVRAAASRVTALPAVPPAYPTC
jgi:hypothetical protein